MKCATPDDLIWREFASRQKINRAYRPSGNIECGFHVCVVLILE